MSLAITRKGRFCWTCKIVHGDDASRVVERGAGKSVVRTACSRRGFCRPGVLGGGRGLAGRATERHLARRRRAVAARAAG